MKGVKMELKDRKTKAQHLLAQLAAIEQATVQVSERQHPDAKPADTLAALRLRLTAVEHQAALLRLLQAEDRLRQGLWKLATGVLGLLLGLGLRSWVG